MTRLIGHTFRRLRAASHARMETHSAAAARHDYTPYVSVPPTVATIHRIASDQFAALHGCSSPLLICYIFSRGRGTEVQGGGYPSWPVPRKPIAGATRDRNKNLHRDIPLDMFASKHLHVQNLTAISQTINVTPSLEQIKIAISSALSVSPRMRSPINQLSCCH